MNNKQEELKEFTISLLLHCIHRDLKELENWVGDDPTDRETKDKLLQIEEQLDKIFKKIN